jgi:type IV pilus assembly protein PilB
MASKIGELLIRKNIISAEQLKRAVDDQRSSNGRLSTSLTKLGLINETDLTNFISKQYGMPTIDLDQFEVDEEIIKLLPEEMVLKHMILPVNRVGSTMVIATADPSNMFAIDDVKFLTGYNVEMVVSTDAAIKKAIDKYYHSGTQMQETVESFDDSMLEIVDTVEDGPTDAQLEQAGEDAPVVKLVNLVLSDGIKRRASDIHIEPYEKYMRVRFRIDGVMYEMMKPPLKIKEAVVSRIKIMANLNIAERRLPQDGRIKMKLGKGEPLDFRVSICPTLFGEKTVIRILSRQALDQDMAKLGFEADQLNEFKKAILLPYGMMLITGPSGCGKTTTLYSALAELNTLDTNLCTAEDPVEYNVHGINQVHVKEDIGMTFASALRAFLRQDPDIIMVGEIRDYETVEIAIKAALTGHLVLSTLHTNDAPSTVTRLLNMGVEPFLVASSVVLVSNQRLIRKVCDKCREQVEANPKTLISMGVSPKDAESAVVFKGTGCDMCNKSGYMGRVAIYEIMTMARSIRDGILRGMSTAEIKKLARNNGMMTLRESALRKLLAGITSMEEVARATSADK